MVGFDRQDLGLVFYNNRKFTIAELQPRLTNPKY